MADSCPLGVRFIRRLHMACHRPVSQAFPQSYLQPRSAPLSPPRQPFTHSPSGMAGKRFPKYDRATLFLIGNTTPTMC